jgi:hypothetical protein
MLLADDQPETILRARSGMPALSGWTDGPRESEHAIIYLGGSSESVELRREALGRALPDTARYFMPYRGFGPNRALISDEKALKADSSRLFELLRERHDKVSIIARSLGTGIGVAMGAHFPVHRLGLITPYDSIAKVAQHRYRWLPAERILRDRFESWRDAGGVEAPVVVCLAGKDTVIPLPHWHELRRHFKTPPREHNFADADHASIATVPGVWSALADFIMEPTRDLLNKQGVGRRAVGP